MACADFKKRGRFRGTLELVNTTNNFNPGAEPTERIWPLQAAKPALQLVINGVAQIRREPSQQVLNRSFVFPMHRITRRVATRRSCSASKRVWFLRSNYTFVALKLARGEARRRGCIRTFGDTTLGL